MKEEWEWRLHSPAARGYVKETVTPACDENCGVQHSKYEDSEQRDHVIRLGDVGKASRRRRHSTQVLKNKCELNTPSRGGKPPARENSKCDIGGRAGVWARGLEVGILFRTRLTSRTHWDWTLSHTDSRKLSAF